MLQTIMPEEIEEQETQQFDADRYRDIVRRRHVLFLVLLLLGWAAVWGSSWFLKSRYKSGTLILVEEPTMPKDYVVPNVSGNIQSRLQSITQQITSRTRLLQIIDKLNLYQGARPALSPDEKVELMRKDIEVELVQDAHKESISAFKISYTAPDPHVAQLVTSELTNQFINENLKARSQESQNTTAFIGSQLESARTNLEEQDAKVKAFRSMHVGELPSQSTSNLQILSGLQAQLQSEQNALNAASQQYVYHQSLAEQYRSLQGGDQAGGAASGGLAGVEQKIENLKARLQALRSRYTEQYPEVQEVKSELAEAEKSKEKMIANMKKVHSQGQKGDAIEEGPSRNTSLLQLQSQEKSDQVEIANRKQAISNLKARINEYQGRLNAGPAVEQQLADLTRGYEQYQANYNELLKKENDSQMATSMEQMQEGGRFTILDPPSLPQKPDFPNRMKLCGVGTAAGLGLALLVVALLEFLDGRLRSDREIESLLTVPVISEIPEIIMPSDGQLRKARAVRGWVMAAAVIMLILAGTAFSYFRP